MAGGTWIILIDIALMLVIVIFCLRALRVPNTFKHSKRLTELEVSLRSLIREAASSGATFNDELLARKQELEKLLLELEHNGARLASTKEAARSMLNSLIGLQERGQSLNERLCQSIESANSIIKHLLRASDSRAEEQAPSAPSFKNSVSLANEEVSSTTLDELSKAKVALDLLVEKVAESDSGSALAEPIAQNHSAPRRSLELHEIPNFERHSF